MAVADIVTGAPAEAIDTDVHRSAGTLTIVAALAKTIFAAERSVCLTGVRGASTATGRHIANRILTGTVCVILAGDLTVAI